MGHTLPWPAAASVTMPWQIEPVSCREFTELPPAGSLSSRETHHVNAVAARPKVGRSDRPSLLSRALRRTVHPAALGHSAAIQSSACNFI